VEICWGVAVPLVTVVVVVLPVWVLPPSSFHINQPMPTPAARATTATVAISHHRFRVAGGGVSGILSFTLNRPGVDGQRLVGVRGSVTGGPTGRARHDARLRVGSRTWPPTIGTSDATGRPTPARAGLTSPAARRRGSCRRKHAVDADMSRVRVDDRPGLFATTTPLAPSSTTHAG